MSFLILLCVATLMQIIARPVDDEVQHLIIFMQENRPFDHYFGTLKGVRGFNDRNPVMLKSGLDAFHQPIDVNDPSQYMLPFRAEANETNAMCMPAPEMYYPTDINMWNGGRMDAWNTARDPGYGMSYFTREDLPYYYTLYDNFLVGDEYHQSTFTCTNPNRMHLFTGSNGLSVGQGCVLENQEPRPGYNWTTAAEVLEAKGISWRVYQQADNFDDNAFAWFANFQQSRPGDALFDKGLVRQLSLFDALDEDMTKGTLPTVSWVIAPTRKSEHATNHPCAGEDFTARVLQVLQKHPEVYKNTVFVLDYDEGGQFYDHAFTPTPPMNENEGYSSVTTVGEVNNITLTTTPQPIGLGYRVPLLLVSPWTRGNLVFSQVLDHTSILQFMETWLNVTVDVISPWRRLVTGDMLKAFDFAHPDYSWPQNLPDTSKYVPEGDVECHTLPDPIIPSEQSMPLQEEGTRIARPTGYELLVSDVVVKDSLTVKVSNIGSEAVPFVLFNLNHLDTDLPRNHALSADSTFTLSDARPLLAEDKGVYAYALQGPNGFMREFRGNAEACAAVSMALIPDAQNGAVKIQLKNEDATSREFYITDNVYGLLEKTMVVTLAAGASETITINVASVGHWYDISVAISATENAYDTSCAYRRFMGHVETGKDSISDPAMGAGKARWLEAPTNSMALKNARVGVKHPALPDRITKALKHKPTDMAKMDKDARFFSKDYTPKGANLEL